MRVLIAVDGSEGGWEAIRQTAPLLSPGRDEVALFHSQPQVRFQSRDAAGVATAAVGDEVLEVAKKHVPAAIAHRLTLISSDEPARQGILKAAEAHNADLISIGGRGASALEGLFLGSVARHIVRNSDRPVLVARAKPDKASDTQYSALLAIDETPPGPKGLGLLKKLSWPSGSSARLIHITRPLFGDQVPEWVEQRARQTRDESLSEAWVKEFETEKRDTYARLAQICGQLPPPFCDSEPVLLEGVPADKIIETVIADDIDLLIAQARNLSALQRFVLGSTTEKLVHYCPSSVLVLHE